MRRFALSLILVFNSFALAACSSYETAAMPTDPASEAEADSQPPELRAGMQARIHLLSGDVFEGEVISVAESHVTLGKPSNRGFVETTYAFEDIEKCEVLTDGRGVTSLGVVIAIVIGGLVVFFGGLTFSGFS